LTTVSSTVAIAFLASSGSNRVNARIGREARNEAIWCAAFSTMLGSVLVVVFADHYGIFGHQR